MNAYILRGEMIKYSIQEQVPNKQDTQFMWLQITAQFVCTVSHCTTRSTPVFSHPDILLHAA